jgi:L-serine dehydratase
MVAARRFLLDNAPLDDVTAVTAELYGSLALTGVGHATDKAVLLGLMGETPQDVDPPASTSNWRRPKRRPAEAAGQPCGAVPPCRPSAVPHG